MMLETLGEQAMADQILAAIERVTAEGRVLTPDLGGTSTTWDVTDEICARLKAGTTAH
jgi:tartrate dehydrogenase/decarboxylase/D-malate dehydrogenase